MVEDGGKVSEIKVVRVRLLSSPCLRSGVVDVHIGRIGLVTVQDVDSVEELREVACGICAVERTALRSAFTLRDNKIYATYGLPEAVISVALPAR